MQIFGTSTSPLVTGIGVGTGASKYTDLVTQYVNALATGSKASLDDKLNAYQGLQSLLFSSSSADLPGVLFQTNKNDAERAADALQNSDLSKQMQQVTVQFDDAGMAATSAAGNGSFNIAQSKLDGLARLSTDQQKMLFVAQETNIPTAHMVGNQEIYYTSLDAWKTALKSQATAFDANSTSGDTTSSASTTIAASSTAAVQTMAANKAAVALPTQSSAATTGASAALQILLIFRAEMDAEKISNAALAGKTETSAVPSYSVPRTAATLQTAASQATSSKPVDQLKVVA